MIQKETLEAEAHTAPFDNPDRKSILISALSLCSIFMLFLRWFDLPAATPFFGRAAFSGIGLVTIHQSFGNTLSPETLSMLIFPAILLGICLLLHILTVLLLLFGDTVNGFANAMTASIVSLTISFVMFVVFASSHSTGIYLNEAFYLYMVISLLSLVFSARCALTHG